MRQCCKAMVNNSLIQEIVRVKRIDPAAAKPRFQLRDGSVELMKVFSLGGSERVGATWKIPPPTDETFDARYGRW